MNSFLGIAPILRLYIKYYFISTSYPQIMRGHWRTLRMYTFTFLIVMIPCKCNLVSSIYKSVNKSVKDFIQFKFGIVISIEFQAGHLYSLQSHPLFETLFYLYHLRLNIYLYLHQYNCIYIVVNIYIFL